MFSRVGLGTTILAMVLAAGCGGKDGADGTDGTDGTNGTDGVDGTDCSAVDNGDGTVTITCGDGIVVVSDGTDGTDCSVTDNGDGTYTITCGDGTVIITDGNDGLNAGETYGIFADVSISAPANTTHFVTGESVVITIEFIDKFGDAVALTDLSTAALYMNGPRETGLTESCSAMLGASTDRSVTPHHYVNLKTTTSSQLQKVGDRLIFTTNAIASEAPGTYTVGVRAVRADTPLDQIFELADLQIGTATVEPHIVGNCDSCHKGAANGVTYMHHVDGNPGSPSIDSAPVRTCKQCHSQDGYASVRVCDDGSKPQRDTSTPPKYICADLTENWSYLNDAIIRRVHGVHNGANLLSNYNTNPDYGDFGDYTDVVFPANIEACTTCHLTDDWKSPSTQACTACHDNLDMASGDYVPFKTIGAPMRLTSTACTANSNCVGIGNERCDTAAGFCQIQACTTNAHCVDAFSEQFDGLCNTDSGLCELRSHYGGAATDDTECTVCHGPSKMAAVDTVHVVEPPDFTYDIDISLTPAPANGQYYVAGEKPAIRMVMSQDGSPIDHTTIAESNPNINRAYLFVNGPRGQRIPGLTSAARAEIKNTVAGPWNLTGTALQIKFGNYATMTLAPTLTTMPNVASAAAADVVAYLNANTTFKALAFAYTADTDTRVVIAAKPSPVRRQIEVLSSTMATAMGYAVAVTDAKAASTSYAANSFLAYTDTTKWDPKVTWTTGYVDYQLDDVGTVAAGTYTVFVNFGRNATGLTTTNDYINFQVGVATEDKVAANCSNCHADERMHGSYPFEADVCGSCHDYKRGAADRTSSTAPLDGWGVYAASGRSNMGYGAAPISRRAHGMHFSAYVDKPEAIHGSSTTMLADIPLVIFPQDVRNCVKCHSDSDSWTAEPSRLACNACHDSDAAVAHGLLNTWDPTPVDPWNGDELESCATCHGEDREFAPSVVHNIWDPYVPPYARDPE